MTKTHVRRALVGAAVTVAAAGMTFGLASPASAHTVTTNFNMSCAALPTGYPNEHQVESSSMTVTHVTDSVYQFRTGAKTTPSSAFGYTFKGLEKLKYVYSVDLTKFSSASLVSGTGYGFTGTPTVTLVGSTLVVEDSVATKGMAVAPTTTYQPPTLQVTLNAPSTDSGVKHNTAGTAGQYGNAANYFTFTAKATTWLGANVSAPTMCLPANGPLGNSDLGTSPTLNTGAGVLH